jgi:hypothetical protein
MSQRQETWQAAETEQEFEQEIENVTEIDDIELGLRQSQDRDELPIQELDQIDSRQRNQNH